MGEGFQYGVHWLGGFVRDVVSVAAAGGAILTIVVSALWALYGQNLLGKAGVASAMDVQELAYSVDKLTDVILKVTGEDQVIRVQRERSYIQEPVYKGDDISLVMFVERTDSGADCIFLNGTSVFEDVFGSPTSGSSIRPTVQLSPDPRKITLTLTPPPNLLLGRVLTWLSLEYDCVGQRTFQTTPTFAFNLLPARGID